MGTLGCNAMRKASFLTRPSRVVGLRVPWGAVAIDSPWRSFSTAGPSAARAWGVLQWSA